MLAPVQAIIALGIGWLAVRLRGGPADIAGEVVSLLLLTAGIVLTAYHVPSELPAGPADIMPGGGAVAWQRWGRTLPAVGHCVPDVVVGSAIEATPEHDDF